MTTSPPNPTAPVSYESARDELGAVVQQLEAGGLTLEQSLALWERGEELAASCQKWLDSAHTRLEAAHPDAAEAVPE